MPATTHALTDGQALSVSSFSKINIRFNADAEDVKLEGSVADSEFTTIHDRVLYGGPVAEDSLGQTTFSEGRLITLDVGGIEEIRFTGAATNINVAPFDESLIVAAATEGDVRAAIELVNAQGGGTVVIMRGLVTLTAPLPIYSGVRVRGTTLGRLTFVTIPDSEWNFDENDITLFKGNGTFNAFQHNHVGTGTLPTNQAAFANEMISNFALECMAFDNFTSAIHIGSQNRGGGFFFHIRDILVKNTKAWGVRFTNSMHGEIERVKIVDSFVGGAALFEGDCPTDILQTGNFQIRHLFACPSGDAASNTVKQRRQARGVVFRASHSGGGSNIGILNQVRAYEIQVNQFNRTTLSVTATFTNGSANISVPDGTEYIVGMPVRFTTTPVPNFLTNTVYIVRSVIGNVITLALDRTSAVISAGAGGSATMVTNGMPCMEVYSDTAGSRITHCKFVGLDLEGEYGAGLYVDRTAACRFEILQFGIGANNVDLVGRDAQNSDFQSQTTTITDLDSASAGSNFVGRQTRLNRPGKGFFFDTALGAHCFSVGGAFTSAQRVTGGDGFRMAVNAAFGLQPISRTATLVMANNHFGSIELSGTTSGQSLTLPSVSNSTGESGNSGCVLFITNASTQSWTIQTTGGQVFNGVVGKTSFVIPAGQAAWLSANQAGYGAILGAPLP